MWEGAVGTLTNLVSGCRWDRSLRCLSITCHKQKPAVMVFRCAVLPASWGHCRPSTAPKVGVRWKAPQELRSGGLC